MTWNTRFVPAPTGLLAVHERTSSAAAHRTPLVLLHGFTGSGRDWERVADHLGDVHIVAPDLPGHGESTVDVGTFAECARGVVEAVATLGHRRFALAGYSMGGRLALQIALAFPERVEGLLLEGGSPGIAEPSARAARRRDDDALAEFVLAAGIEAFVDRWERTPVLAAEARLPAQERSALRARRMLCRPQGLAASLRRMGTGVQPWLGDRLAEIAVPTFLVVGSEDEKFRRIARDMQAHVVGAQLEIVADAGHNVHLAQPRRFAEIVAAFLETEPGPAEERCKSHG